MRLLFSTTKIICDVWMMARKFKTLPFVKVCEGLSVITDPNVIRFGQL